MARLPIPGSDNGTWGDILNTFLSVEHNNDGSLKASGTLAQKADDTAVVHIAGTETVTGAKTFSVSPVVPTPSASGHASTKAYIDNGLLTKANTSTTISAGTGLTGGGDLSANRTLNVTYGVASGTAAQGNDSRITGAVQSTLVDAKGDLLVASAADTVLRLPVGSNTQVLTADSTQITGVKWATPSGGGSSSDLIAMRFGCKAMTFTPHDVSHQDPQFISMVDLRLYTFWLALPAGTTITGVRLPISAVITGGGSLTFTVYQEDLSQLGITGDVRAAFAAGSNTTWRNSPLTVPAATTGAGIWVTAHTTISSGALSVVFCNTANLPAWLLNPGDRKTALRIEGVGTPPATLDLSSAVDYIDILIGVY